MTYKSKFIIGSSFVDCINYLENITSEERALFSVISDSADSHYVIRGTTNPEVYVVSDPTKNINWENIERTVRTARGSFIYSEFKPNSISLKPQKREDFINKKYAEELDALKKLAKEMSPEESKQLLISVGVLDEKGKLKNY